MAWRTKDATIFLVDVGRSMQETFASSAEGDKVTKADVGLRLARTAAQQKLFFLPKHEVGVVFFGTAETSNDLFCAEEESYQNIFVGRERKIDVPDVELLALLSNMPAGGHESDAVSALIVAIDLMIKRTGEMKYDKTIRLITDQASVEAGDPDMLECVKQLEKIGGRLCLTILGSSEIGAWSSLAGSSTQVDLVPLSSLAREISLCVKPVEQRAKVRLSLSISPGLQIPVGIYSKTTRVSFPTLKKQSKTAAAIPIGDRKTDKVIMDRTYHVTDDPDGEEVKKEDRIKGHKYGQSIVPMSEYDEAALMYSCDRTLTTLGFAAASSIGPEHSMSHTEAVAADKGDRWAHCAFESIIEAMAEQRKVLIARYVYRKDGQPRMVALIPLKGENGQSSSMIMQYLPFTEDIREWTCASLPEPTAEQRQAVSYLFDTMALEKADGAESELLRPEGTNNPALSRFYSFLAQRAVNEAAKLEPTNQTVAATIVKPPPAVIESLSKAESENEKGRLKATFPLEKVEKAQGGRGTTKRFWREAIAESSKGKLGEVDIKKIKVDPNAVLKKVEKKEEEDGKVGVKDESSQNADGAAFGMAAAVEPAPRVHIGSVHPERDFEHWLSQRKGGVDTVGPAIEQMCNVICRFAEEGEDFHGKALSCLAALRRGCVKEGEATSYNEFLRKLRLGYTRRQAQVWQKIAQDKGLGLITDSEVVTSTVSSEEARAFLAGEDIASAGASASSAHASGRDSGVPEGSGVHLSEKELEDMIE
eukprot:TRINITY_DN33335_c0_g1_i1.p1 TRINITY_DN33335_c0_g1~~TRINITY_DN33335_c0_g1_i1.p1  ORF type:complete len:761 (-),score=189.73 TRINITY_DN33335_c0_g1_i1:56-2338(-)